jgi:uncharacterized membrane protein YgcG
MRERLIWISSGLLGLVLAAALTSATSRVTRPDVGLAGEPVAAGALAPPTSDGRRNLPAAIRATARPAKRTRKRAKKRTATASSRRATAPAPPAAAATPAAPAATAAAPRRTRTRTRPARSATRATAKSRPAVRAKINRPPVPLRIPPPTATVDDHGGGDHSGRDSSGDGSGKDGGGSSGGGSHGGGDD